MWQGERLALALSAARWAGLLVVCCLTVFVLKSIEGSVPVLCGRLAVYDMGLCSANQQCQPVSMRSAGLDVRVGQESRARAWGLPCVLPLSQPQVSSRGEQQVSPGCHRTPAGRPTHLPMSLCSGCPLHINLGASDLSK